MHRSGDSIVWEVPSRGVLLRDKATVKAAYLKLFESYQIHRMIPVRRFAAGNWVTDDTIAEMTLVGDVARVSSPIGGFARSADRLSLSSRQLCWQRTYRRWPTNLRPAQW